MDTLYISGLGSPQIALNGQIVKIKRRKTVALLVYLAVEGSTRSREFLSGLFWPEYDQSKAYAYLRRALWEINTVIGNEWLEVNREWIGILSSVNIQTDVSQFQALLREVQEHDHPFEEPCELCINQLEAAMRLYRGDFLEGFSLRDCPQFDDWQFLQSELMRRMFQGAIQDLVNALEQSSRINRAIPYAHRWLTTDNLDERAHRKLMTLFAKNDQVNAALRQFEVCQTVLKKELDLTPEAATTYLYNQIRERHSSPSPMEVDRTEILLTGGDETSWLEQIISSPVRVVCQSNLPVQITPFVGREDEIRNIVELLHSTDCWLLTLTGMGGVGKTRLANQIGQVISEVFPDGIYFVSLEGMKANSSLLVKVAEALGLSFYPQAGSLDAQLNSYLHNKSLLIIFDNFDELVSEAAILHQMHAAAASVKFLVTSREKLKISGEWVFEVQGLGHPELDTPKFEEILRYPAIELFNYAACRTSNHFKINLENYRDTVAIAQFVEGMPLGLEMAASWVDTISPKEILTEIRSNLDFLKTEFQDMPVRQRTMRAVLDYSCKCLNFKDQSALARLSVFQAGFTREAAEKVTRVSLTDLKKLMDQSFIHQKDPGEYHIHELMRQYALEKLRQSPENYKNSRDRHASFYCVALSSWRSGLIGPNQVELLPIIRREIENIQAAWTWVTQEKQIEQIKMGLGGLCYFYLRTLRNQEGLQVCQLGLDSLEKAGAESEQEIQVKLLAWKSIFCLNLDDHKIAKTSIDFALEIMKELGVNQKDFAPLRARILMTKAIVENYLGNRDIALAYYDQAFEYYQQSQDFSDFSYLMLRSLDIGGITSEKAYQFLSDAVHFKRKTGDLFNIAYLSYAYCMIVAYHLGQPTQAAVLMQESCEIFGKLGDALSKEMSLVAVDPILNTNGRYEELLKVREKKLAYAHERGDRQAIGICLAEIGETFCHLGDYPSAENHFKEALIRLEDGPAYQYAFRLCGFGEVLLVQNKISESYAVFQEGIAGMKNGEKWGQGKALAGLSIAAFKMGKKQKAWELIRQALQHHYEGHTHYFSYFSLGPYAYLLSQRGDLRTAIEIYAMLAQQSFVSDSYWFNDLYRKPICASAMEKKSDEIKEAKLVGKEMNLWKMLEQIIEQAKV